MTCYHPLRAYRLTQRKTEKGKAVIVWNVSEIEGNHEEIELPCSRCIGCRLDKSRDWALRCVHEAQTMEEEEGLYSSFITLTYSPENYNVSLVADHFPAFMKRLRRFHSRYKWSTTQNAYRYRRASEKVSRISYFQCGEYGDMKSRPHHHACIFGYDFPDKELIEVNENGDNYYSSPALEKLWSFGMCIIGDLSWTSAAYVARYTTKKVNGKLAESYYRQADINTGEILPILPEFATMSRRPAIGRRWLEKYSKEVWTNDFITFNGKRFRSPRAYDKVLDERDPEALEVLKQERLSQAACHAHDNTLRRLRDREVVKKAQTKSLGRM
jgi:hypothetical protein